MATKSKYGSRDEVMAEPGEAGSIEQQLDMNESGPLRGDEIDHRHGVMEHSPLVETSAQGVDTKFENNFEFDMAEEDREGDDLSGDEHSSGLQGEEQELHRQTTISSGAPGEGTEEEEMEGIEEAKHRAA